MSRKLIDHSLDVKRLRDLGYEVEIVESILLIHSIPYVNAKKELLRGTLVSNVSLAHNQVARPNTHVVYFVGEYPCNVDGSAIEQLRHQSNKVNLGYGIVADHSFSNKPPSGYKDYVDKMTQYIKILTAPAQSIDETVTAQTYKVIESKEFDSVLHYNDTNASRAEINAINENLRGLKIGIIGLGGTGSYILDQVAKTLVGEIHLFDGDLFLQHNAFRAPGAPKLAQLNERISKVEYFSGIYSNMHKHIIPHEIYIDESNVAILSKLDFVFVCIDKSEIKKFIFKKLQSLKIPFIDTGIGVERVEDKLTGMVRTTASGNSRNKHVWNGLISFADYENDDYSSNIQISDLNAFNAMLAVIKWKKFFGFYSDLEQEHHSIYSVNVNQMVNEEVST
jgi:hypothetical protein